MTSAAVEADAILVITDSTTGFVSFRTGACSSSSDSFRLPFLAFFLFLFLDFLLAPVPLLVTSTVFVSVLVTSVSDFFSSFISSVSSEINLEVSSKHSGVNEKNMIYLSECLEIDRSVKKLSLEGNN